MLFIHARSPWDMHDFIVNLQKLPLGIVRAMYLEGGPEASSRGADWRRFVCCRGKL